MSSCSKKIHFSAARLSAVQASYAHTLSENSWDQIISRFLTGEAGGLALVDLPGGGEESVCLAEADADLFTKIVRVLQEQGDDIDRCIKACLSEKVVFERLDMTLKSILRTGIAEFYANPELDAPVIITEYTDITRGFYGQMEINLVNAVLDRFSKVVRCA